MDERGGIGSTRDAMASLYETLRADIVVAMKARDQVTLTVLR